MAFCTNCGMELEEGAKFCAQCGKATNEKNQPIGQRINVYDGEIHKCPNCGETLKSFIAQCPLCGFELRGTVTEDSVREFALKLEDIERKRDKKKHSFNPLKPLSNSIGLNSTDEQKVSLIRSFLIPNTKEAILEFMILASSNIDFKLYGMGDKGVLTASQREISDAWLAKFEQAYEKAKLVLTGEDFNNINNIYVKTLQKLRKEKLKLPLLIAGCIIGPVLIIVFCLIMAQFE